MRNGHAAWGKKGLSEGPPLRRCTAERRDLLGKQSACKWRFLLSITLKEARCIAVLVYVLESACSILERHWRFSKSIFRAADGGGLDAQCLIWPLACAHSAAILLYDPSVCCIMTL